MNGIVESFLFVTDPTEKIEGFLLIFASAGPGHHGVKVGPGPVVIILVQITFGHHQGNGRDGPVLRKLRQDF
jgi:hypothetical protein